MHSSHTCSSVIARSATRHSVLLSSWPSRPLLWSRAKWSRWLARSETTLPLWRRQRERRGGRGTHAVESVDWQGGGRRSQAGLLVDQGNRRVVSTGRKRRGRLVVIRTRRLSAPAPQLVRAAAGHAAPRRPPPHPFEGPVKPPLHGRLKM